MAMSYGFLVRPHLVSIWQSLAEARSRYVTSPGDDEAALKLLTVPPELNALLADMHHLDEAGHAVHRALMTLYDLREEIVENSYYVRCGGEIYDNDGNFEGLLQEPGDVDASFQIAMTAVGNARKLISNQLRE